MFAVREGSLEIAFVPYANKNELFAWGLQQVHLAILATAQNSNNLWSTK